MAQVVDRWHTTRAGPDEKPCAEHGTKTRTAGPPSNAHNKGKRWQVRWRDHSGKQCKENFGRRTDADTRADTIGADLLRGQYIDVKAGRESFRAVAERWRTAQPHRKRTADAIESRLRVHAYPAYGDRPIATIRPSEIQAWAVALVKTHGLSPRTARSVFNAVRPVFNAALRDGIIPRSPCAGVRLVPVPHQEPVPLTAAEVLKLAGAVPDEYRALVILAAGTGLRCGELFGLEWRHLDLFKRTVSVEQQWQKGIVCPPKTERSHRTVPLSATVVAHLNEHVAQHPGRPTDPVFVKPPTFTKYTWPAAVKAAGLPGHTGIHTLRHTYASLLIRHGAGPKVLAARLGDTVTVAMETYAHLFPAEDDTTRDAVDDFFKEAS